MLKAAIEIREDVALAPLTTFGVGGPARYFAVAKSEDDVVKAVESTPGAIGVIDVYNITSGVKVVKIDEKQRGHGDFQPRSGAGW